MSRQQFKIALGFLAVLVLANVIYYLFSGWGLITVKVHDAPVGQVIRSIERQGWVTIYSNLDPQTKISMYVDHVPLPEAMATLAVNADAQWHLGFFVGPNQTKVKEEIRSFTGGGDSDDSTKIYNFPAALDMLDDDDTMPVADPRKQKWLGVKAPAAPAAPDPNAAAAAGAFGFTPPPPPPPPSSVQGYLRSFALGADVWIMAPADWDPAVPTAPPPQDSISAAIDKFIGNAHGSVTEALVLRGRPQRVAGDQRPRNYRGGGMDFSMMEDRMDNEINGLPPSYQPEARTKLAQEVQFQKEVRSMPPDQRRQAMMSHYLNRRMGGFFRRSPEKRAQMYARLVGNRMTAQGK